MVDGHPCDRLCLGRIPVGVSGRARRAFHQIDCFMRSLCVVPRSHVNGDTDAVIASVGREAWESGGIRPEYKVPEALAEDVSRRAVLLDVRSEAPVLVLWNARAKGVKPRLNFFFFRALPRMHELTAEWAVTKESADHWCATKP